MAWSVDLEARLRREAMAWLAIRSNDGNNALSREDVSDFTFDGEPFPLVDAQRGIRKPAQLRAALSILTTYTRPGRPRPYDDAIDPDGMIGYKWRGEDGDHPENRALRTAQATGVPLIWFFGVGGARYLPIYPVFIASEEPSRQQFNLQIAELPVALRRVADDSPAEAWTRRYLVTQTRQRLHQPVFRAHVLRAYTQRCAVCSLAHPPLLDAAHIAPDATEEGIAAVSNGLALCRIHHSAYDTDILGISPDLRVDLRADILAEIDGPMLRHGLQELHGQRLRVVPRRVAEQPDRGLLDRRWQRYRHAG